MRMEQFHIYLKKDQVDFLKKYSEEIGVPISIFIRMAVDEKIKKLVER